MEPDIENVDSLIVIPMIDNKPVPNGDLVGDALSIISLKELPSDDVDPDSVIKRNSFRDLHHPNISDLIWIRNSSSKEEVYRVVSSVSKLLTCITLSSHKGCFGQLTSSGGQHELSVLCASNNWMCITEQRHDMWTSVLAFTP